MAVKLPAVAGSFYPADVVELKSMLQQCLAGNLPENASQPRAIIAPHAGYIYSGPIAGNAYRILQAMPQIKHVVLLGPAHYVPVSDAVLSTYSTFRTPLGDIPVNEDARNELLTIPKLGLFDAAFAQEHSLEVQLPFLQTVLSDFTITPILVGKPDKSLVTEILKRFWDKPDTLIVVSSDLSHYHDYNTAKQIDNVTLSNILQLNPNALMPQHACGCYAMQGLLEFAKQKKLLPKVMDARNSGDTQADKKRVVGYSAIHFYEGKSVVELLDEQHEKLLLAIAKQSIAFGLKYQKSGQITLAQLPMLLHYPCATFVTLTINKKLRGCIGSLEPHLPLAQDVVQNAYAAAFQDPRFPPLQADEFEKIAIEISLLSATEPMSFHDEKDLIAQLRPGVDGVLIADGKYRGVFLPLVWHSIPGRQEFWQALKHKAGMPENFWSSKFQAWRFTTKIIEIKN